MTELSTYALESLGRNSEFVLYRGRREADRRHILVVATLSKKPAQRTLRRLENEYALRAKLDPAWAVLPLELVRDKGRTMLVLEDLGGEPLDRLLEGPLELTRLLSIRSSPRTTASWPPRMPRVAARACISCCRSLRRAEENEKNRGGPGQSAQGLYEVLDF